MVSLSHKRYACAIIILCSKITLKRVLPQGYIRINTINFIVNHTF